jgi:hypothetical protein
MNIFGETAMKLQNAFISFVMFVCLSVCLHVGTKKMPLRCSIKLIMGRVAWDGARILEIGSDSRYRKYKESVNMACLINPFRQPLQIFLISGSPLSSMWLPAQREDQ